MSHYNTRKYYEYARKLNYLILLKLYLENF
jgi:hypothetical protein